MWGMGRVLYDFILHIGVFKSVWGCGAEALVQGISRNRERQRKFEEGAPVWMHRPLGFAGLIQAIREQQNA
jgi:hypothetical protein